MGAVVDVTYRIKIREEALSGTRRQKQYTFESLIADMAREGLTGWLQPSLEAFGIDVATLKREYGVQVKHLGRFDVDSRVGVLTLRIPISNLLCSHGAMPLLLTMISSVLSLPDIEEGQVTSIDLPEEYLGMFPGPGAGVQGFRDLLDVHDRPLLAFSVKPRVGLSPDEYARVCAAAARGHTNLKGVDIVEDDEKLVDPKYCSIDDRVKAVSNALREVEQVTGERKIYAVNISGRPDRIVDLASRVIEMGADAVKVDFFPTGISVIQSVAEHFQANGIVAPIASFPGMYKLFERILDREVIVMLARLVGVDVFYAGTPSLEGRVGRINVDSYIRVKHLHAILKGDWDGFKSTLPTVASGIHPGSVGCLVSLLGNDLGLFIGSAISAFDQGPGYGAELVRRAIDAELQGVHDPSGIFDHSELELLKSKRMDFISYNDVKDQVTDVW